MNDFLKYWDTRIDAHERFFNNYPHIANFAFSECQALWGYMEEERNALRARVARLEEALNEISTLYWVDAPAPEEMRRIARRALEEK